jgi:predicted amidohydrolase YtcJ
MGEPPTAATIARMKLAAICAGAILLGSGTAQPATKPADLVLTGGRFYTVDAARPWAEAVAIRGGSIVYVGDDAGARAFVGPKTRQHALAGRLVLPGLVDSHTHPGLVTSSGDYFLLPQTLDPAELLRAVGDQARSHPNVPILVGGYWPIAAFPTSGPRKEDLDRIVPDRPVVLFDDSGHSQWLNSRALALMGVDRTTPDLVPDLSSFARDPNGELTGWARERAAIPYLRKMGLSPKVNREELHEFLAYLVSKGVTTLFDAGNDDRDDEVYTAVAQLERESRLPLRYEGCVHVTAPDGLAGAVARLERLRAAYAGERLRFRTVKIHYDGVSEIGTSSVLEPFISNPLSRGNTLVSGDRLSAFMLELEAKDIDLHLHTVGDAAVRTALDAREAAQARLGRPLRSRLTLCHDELVSPADVTRFKTLGVVANFTPHWNGGYFGGADRTLGLPRYNRMYSIKPLLATGATVTFSSDITDHIEWKTSRGDPFLGIQIGHNRQEPAGGKDAAVRPPENERLPLEELVKGYTLNGASQLGLEQKLGSIQIGKLADLVVLGNNLFEVDRYAISTVSPSAVLFEGSVVSGSLP